MKSKSEENVRLFMFHEESLNLKNIYFFVISKQKCLNQEKI